MSAASAYSRREKVKRSKRGNAAFLKESLAKNFIQRCAHIWFVKSEAKFSALGGHTTLRTTCTALQPVGTLPTPVSASQQLFDGEASFCNTNNASGWRAALLRSSAKVARFAHERFAQSNATAPYRAANFGAWRSECASGTMDGIESTKLRFPVPSKM